MARFKATSPRCFGLVVEPHLNLIAKPISSRNYTGFTGTNGSSLYQGKVFSVPSRYLRYWEVILSRNFVISWEFTKLWSLKESGDLVNV